MYFARKKKNKTKDHIIVRDAYYYQQIHTFVTKVSGIAEIDATLDKAVLVNNNIRIESRYEEGALFFSHAGTAGRWAFASALYYMGQENGKSIFNYQFTECRLYHGWFDSLEANVLLTIIERAFLKLDPSTDVLRALP